MDRRTPQTEAEVIDLLARSIAIEKAKADALRVHAFKLLQKEIEELRKENAALRARSEHSADLLAFASRVVAETKSSSFHCRGCDPLTPVRTPILCIRHEGEALLRGGA